MRAISRWRNISALGIADESLTALAEHGESFYCESVTDAGSSNSNSDPHPSQVVCTLAEGDSSAEELHSDDTATILPAGDAKEIRSYKYYVLSVRVCKTVFVQVPKMLSHGNNQGHFFFFFNILISLGKGRTD